MESRLPGVTIIEMMEADLESGEFTTPQLNALPSREEVLAASKGRSDSVGLSVTFSSSGGGQAFTAYKSETTDANSH